VTTGGRGNSPRRPKTTSTNCPPPTKTGYSTSSTKSSSPWRDPPDYGEPLQNSPYKKIRIGEFRLSVNFRQDDGRLVVARIKRRDGAYTADDD
jgi:hypothetical protein